MVEEHPNQKLESGTVGILQGFGSRNTVKNFLGQRITQMIRSAFENDNSDNNVEVGGGESRWEIRTP